MSDKETVTNDRIGVMHGGSGWFAVHYVDVTDKHGTYTDIQQTGIGRYGTYGEAVREAKEWSKAEGFPYVEIYVKLFYDIKYLREILKYTETNTIGM